MTAEPVPQTHPLLDHRGPWSEEEYVFLTTIADRVVNDAADVPLVAEIVSDSGHFRDRIPKPGLYAEAGILWYIRVEPTPRLVVVLHRLEKGNYVEQARAGAGEHVEIPDLGLDIEVDALLRRQ